MCDRSSVFVCPYNPSHVISKRRYFSHIMKCQTTYKHIVLKVCPFNATHRFKPDEYDEHVISCPQREPIEHYKYFHSNAELPLEREITQMDAEKEVQRGSSPPRCFYQHFHFEDVDSTEADPPSALVPADAIPASSSSSAPIDWSRKLGMGRGAPSSA